MTDRIRIHAGVLRPGDLIVAGPVYTTPIPLGVQEPKPYEQPIRIVGERIHDASKLRMKSDWYRWLTENDSVCGVSFRHWDELIVERGEA